jgi:hypothetical protein
MEYTFKNSPSEKPVTVVLSEYALVVQNNHEEKVIPYLNVQSVSLRKSGKKYFTIIKSADGYEVKIGNWYQITSTEGENRSGQYTAFVRILHYHLREKSAAYYICGNNLQKILITSCVAVIFSFAISFLVEKYQLLPVNTNLIAILLSGASLSAIAAANWENFPSVYKPENIPAKYLP